jgi:regulator of protease activity HflC (stomatin/prohibitin superfamily)
MNPKKFWKYIGIPIATIICIVLVISLVSCSMQYVKPGYVGVIVNLHGSNKGVNHKIVGVGRYYVGINEIIYQFPIFLQTYNYTQSKTEGKPMDESFSFQDKQGMTISSDVGVSYNFRKEDIEKIFLRFQKGPEEITSVYLRSIIRDSFNRCASLRDIQDIYGPKKVDFIDNVQNEVKRQALIEGINVERILLINELRLPPSILQALNEKTEATQRAMKAENELRITQAEAAKGIAKAEGEAKALKARAFGEAEANKMVAASITPTLVEMRKIEKWDGKLPQVSGASTLISLDKK